MANVEEIFYGTNKSLTVFRRKNGEGLLKFILKACTNLWVILFDKCPKSPVLAKS